MLRKLVCLLTVLLIACVHIAEAQQTKKVWRIGFLSSTSVALYSHLYGAFVQGLRDHGYVEGQNLLIEARWADEKTERLPELAAELVRLKVDLIAATAGAVSALAAKNATTTLPITFIGGGDLVRTGVIGSLARPGGNATGLSLLTTELGVKRLELLKESFPKLSRLAVISHGPLGGDQEELEETQIAAAASGVQIESFHVQDPSRFISVYADMKRSAPML